MRVLVWVEPGTWPACVDAALEHTRDREDASFTLLHVMNDEPAQLAAASFGGLMGRGRRENPGPRMEQATEQSARDLVAQAAARLGVAAETRVERGRVERVVTAAADSADLLVVGRDGDRSRLGPHSLGKHTRFVVDHAPCQVLLIWPESAPDLGSIPPPPPPGHKPPPPPHERH